MGMERPSPHAFQVSADRSRLRIAINSAGAGFRLNLTDRDTR